MLRASPNDVKGTLWEILRSFGGFGRAPLAAGSGNVGDRVIGERKSLAQAAFAAWRAWLWVSASGSSTSRRSCATPEEGFDWRSI